MTPTPNATPAPRQAGSAQDHPVAPRLAPTAILHLAGAVSLAAWAALSWISWHPSPRDVWRLLGLLAIAWCALGVVWTQIRHPAPPIRWLPLLFWPAAFRVCGLIASPVLEDDHFRYLWDGRQLVLTGNPYNAPPSAAFNGPELPPDWVGILDQINYPHIPTIYGPVCQAAFGISYLLAPGQLWPWKLLLLAAEAAMVLGIARVGGPRAAALAAWCPLAVFEGSFNAHPDLLGVALLVQALNRVGPGPGFWLGLAVACRWPAVVIVPWVLPLRSWRDWLAGGVTLAAVYAPFAWTGATDLSGLRTFAGQWEFNSSVYAVLAAALGPTGGRLSCAVLFLLIATTLWRRHRSRGPTNSPWPPGEWVLGSFFLVSATLNPWYLLWLVPFLALRPSAVGFTALAAVSLSYLTMLNLGRADTDLFAHPVWVRPLEFGLIAVVGVWEAVRRRHRKVEASRDAPP